MTRRPAVILALAFAGGILGENACGPGLFLGVLSVVITLLVLTVFFRRKIFSVCLVVLAVLCGAFAAWNSALLPADHIRARLDRLHGRDVEVVCRIVTPLDEKPKGLAPRRVFGCDLERVNDTRCTGRLIVNLYGTGNFVYGDRVRLEGKISRPFDFSPGGRISYRTYLARQGIYGVMHVARAKARSLLEFPGGWTWDRMTVEVRVHLQKIFFQYLSPGEAGLMNAMLLGPRGDIPSHVYDIFRKTGTAHIIAISGMNMTLTAFGVMFLLGIFSIPRVPRAVLAVVILAFYSFMAGNSAPVARSALMAGVMILSFVIERETEPLNSLALAALVLLAFDPGQLRDIGCQLSFVCVVSLILLTPLILEPFEMAGWKEQRSLWFLIESAAVTLAAFIGSAGILAYDFGYVSPVGLIVNLPVIPLMALVTALGAGLLGAGLVMPWLVWPFALCLKVVLNMAVGVLTIASAMPVIACAGMPFEFVIVYYLVLGGAISIFYHFRGSRQGVLRDGAFIDKHMPL